MTLDGKAVDVSTIGKAIAAGIAYVTEDRKQLGLVLDENITKNTTLANLPGVSKASVIDSDREYVIATDYRSKLNIRSYGVEQQTVNLSGVQPAEGRAQQVACFTSPEVLILDEPTRGIDVGAKYEIYAIIDALAQEGKGVLMISSEMPELLGMCDRIYVMNEGRFVGEFPGREATQEKIMRAIMRSKELN